jgi:phosphogluconate dehydratase
VDERSIVNAIVALLATGGSTNHLMHWVAVARAAGLVVDWTDFSDLSAVVPLLARVYPNGSADVNALEAAGGPGFVIAQLLDAGLMHEEVLTISGPGLRHQTQRPFWLDGQLRWTQVSDVSADPQVLRTAADPFAPTGGIRLLQGNLGRAIIKVSAVPQEHWVVEAPARIFDSQQALLEAFKAGALSTDMVAVLRYQGPAACGMPELHQLTPTLSVLQERGLRVALVTDGRMSGASGKVPAALHVCPEALHGGALARVRDGDLIRVDAVGGVLEARVPPDEWARREPALRTAAQAQEHAHGLGRDLFAGFRARVTDAEHGACTW